LAKKYLKNKKVYDQFVRKTKWILSELSKNSAVPLDIDPEDLANLGIKDNFESFLKRNVNSEENLKLMKKFGINYEKKKGINPIH